MILGGFRRGHAAFACAALSLVLASCAAAPPATVGKVPNQVNAELGQTGFAARLGDSYVLHPSDVVSIKVFREAELSLDSVVISADGQVSVPLVGQVKAAGMTTPQLEALLESELGARYLREPEVAVNVVQYASHQVTVEGAVLKPGVFAFLPGTRLSGGVQLASGLDRVAKGTEVAVFRQMQDGTYVAKFDYRAVQAGTMLDPVLQPGDRIVVGTDGLSQFYQDLLKALPIFATFTRV